MIDTKNIDIFKEFESSTESVALIHQCNCFNTMGGGIARVISQKYPSASEVDNKTVSGDINKLGGITYSQVRPNMYVFNLYGQYEFGKYARHTDYEAVYTGLENILSRIIKLNIKKVLIPYKMSSNLAGGDWRIIEKIIEVIFENTDIVVTICKIED